MHQNLTGKYGFDKAGRQRRLNLLGFSDTDAELARQLHAEVLHPHCQAIVDGFYDFVTRDAEMLQFIDGPDMLARLKKTHCGYIESLGVDYASDAYFDNRLAVGVVHSRIGLPLSLYLAAYHLLEELIIEQFPDSIRQQLQRFHELSRFVSRIATLDMSLAIDVYHHSKVRTLAESVENLLDEKQQLTTEVQHDALTQTASRRYLMEVLAEEICRAGQERRGLSIAMADLDHFKQINDSHGHLVGDQVLRDVASRIEAAVRDRDTVGRYGGEEFLVIFPQAGIKVAERIAERIRKHIDRSPLHLAELNLPMTISIGIASFQAGDDSESLIRRADEALYRAKQAGRNTVVL